MCEGLPGWLLMVVAFLYHTAKGERHLPPSGSLLFLCRWTNWSCETTHFPETVLTISHLIPNRA